jgi:hypothetical protein
LSKLNREEISGDGALPETVPLSEHPDVELVPSPCLDTMLKNNGLKKVPEQAF